MISSLDLMNDLLSIFVVFAVFRTPFWVVFWDKCAKNWSMEKKSKNESKKRARGTRSAAEAGASGGGEASPRSFAKSLHYRLARPATSERGAADLSRLRRVPAAEIETKSCGSDTKIHLFLMLVKVIFDICWRTWGAERAI